MTTFARNGDQAVSGSEHIMLTITGSYGMYGWSYSSSSLILGGDAGPIEIEVKNETCDGSNAAIVSYASSGMTERHSPIVSFVLPPGGNRAVLMMRLLPNQLIDFGVFVKMTHGHKESIIFCDPQASNDPVKNVETPTGL